MKRRWPLALGILAGLLALYAGLGSGSDQVESWQLAARWTARAGFPIFIITYAASSLARLWPTDVTRTLWRDRRWWGLGFASTHTIHLVALLTYLKVSGDTRPLGVLLFAGGAYTVMYLMVLTSNEAAMRALGRNWKRLHTLGIHWLWVIFFVSYLGRAVKPETQVNGTIGVTIALAALALPVAVWAKGRSKRAAAT